MRKKRKNGFLITFEGVETSGKSTHAKLLKNFLDSKKIKNVFTCEPAGTELGKKIKDLLLSPPSGNIAKIAELFLFAADRAEHVKKIIKPALEEGKIVLVDRFIDSTTAYQAGGRKLPLQVVKIINKISSDNLLPDLTFLFLLDINEMKRRLRLREKAPDRFEKENFNFHKATQEMYLKIARSSSRFVILNGSDDIEKNSNIIKKTVLKKIK